MRHDRFVLLMVALTALPMAFGCAWLQGVDKAAIAEDAAKIYRCQEEGRACKADGGSFCRRDVYDVCMKDAGLRE